MILYFKKEILGICGDQFLLISERKGKFPIESEIDFESKIMQMKYEDHTFLYADKSAYR